MSNGPDIFKQINNAVLDLQVADYKSFERPLARIAHLLEHDSLAVINQDLKQGLDLDAFLEQSGNKEGLGGPVMKWPKDDKTTLGLSLMMVEKMGADSDFAFNFSHDYFGGDSQIISSIRNMTKALIVPFVRDYKDHVMNSSTAPKAPVSTPLRRVFISHGRAKDWLEVQAHIEKDMKLHSLELAQEASQGRTVIEKLEAGAASCDAAVIVMSGDDLDSEGKARVRENVMHEIGFFHGRYGRNRMILLHENGVSVPTNLAGIVYVAYPKNKVDAAFGILDRELRHMYP